MKRKEGGGGMLYENIEAYLKENGITKSHISQKTGISNSTLTAIFQGRRKLLATEYAQICSVLGVSLDAFAADEA